MPKRTSDYRAKFLEDLRDPTRAADYLNAALDDSGGMFLVALRDVAEANRMAKVALEAGLSRETLYRTLSEEGNPRLSSLTGILDAIGIKIAFQPKEQNAEMVAGGLAEAFAAQADLHAEQYSAPAVPARGLVSRLTAAYKQYAEKDRPVHDQSNTLLAYAKR